MQEWNKMVWLERERVQSERKGEQARVGSWFGDSILEVELLPDVSSDGFIVFFSLVSVHFL